MSRTRAIRTAMVFAFLAAGAGLVYWRIDGAPSLQPGAADNGEIAAKAGEIAEPLAESSAESNFSEIAPAPSAIETDLSDTATSPGAPPETKPPETGRRLVIRAIDDATERSVPDARVYVQALNREEPIETRTDENGRAEISGLDPRVYFVWATLDNLSSWGDAAKGREIANLSLEGTKEREIVLRLASAAVLSVRLTEAETGGPIARGRVRLMGLFEQVADERGEARFAAVPYGKVELAATAPGFAFARKVAEIAPEEKFPKIEIEMKPGGVIFGHVTDRAGRAIEDAIVKAESDYGVLPTIALETRTDLHGAYRLESVPFDRVVRVSAKREKLGKESQMWPKRPVTAEKPEKQVDLELQTIEQGDGVFMTRVVDEIGRAVAGAKIYGTFEAKNLLATSDEEGRFRLENLPYIGSAIGLRPFVFAAGYAPALVPLRIEPPEEAQEYEIRLEKGHWVEGRVVDEQGTPIARVKIDPQISSTWPLPSLRTYSDEQGNFRIESLPANTTLKFSADGYAGLTDRKTHLDRNIGDVVLAPTGMIMGRVVDAETGSPVTAFDFRVSLEYENGPRRMTSSYIYTSYFPPITHRNYENKEGVFEVSEFPPGRKASIQIEAEGYAPTAFEHIEVQRQKDAQPALFELSRSGRALGGIVVDDEGQALAGARVIVFVYQKSSATINFKWDDTGITPPGLYRYRGETHTSEDGRFRFETLPAPTENAESDAPYPWPVDLVVQAKGFARKRIREIEKLPEAEWETLVVELDRQARLFGRIDRNKFPNAISLTAVRQPPLASDNNRWHYLSLKPQQAEYAFEELPAGDYLLGLAGLWKSSDPNFQKTVGLLRLTVDLAQGEERELDLGFEDFANLDGRVFYGGEPLARGRVAVTDNHSSTALLRLAETDAFGEFSISHLPPGSYLLFASPDRVLPFLNHSGNAKPASMEFAKTIEVEQTDIWREFHFDRSAKVRGRLMQAAGRPNTVWQLRASLMKSDEKRGPTMSTEVDLDGRFEFNDVSTGTYALHVRENRNRVVDEIIVTQGADIDLGDIETGSIEIKFPQSASLPPDLWLGLNLFPSDTPTQKLNSDTALANFGERVDSTITLEYLRPGPVKILGRGIGWRTDPYLLDLEVRSGQTVRLDWDLEPYTVLSVGISEFLDSAILSSVDGAQTFVLENKTENWEGEKFSWFNDRTVVFHNKKSTNRAELLVLNVPPGRWVLTVNTTTGLTVTREYELMAGELLQDSIQF